MISDLIFLKFEGRVFVVEVKSGTFRYCFVSCTIVVNKENNFLVVEVKNLISNIEDEMT